MTTPLIAFVIVKSTIDATKRETMIAVIFEVQIQKGKQEEYLQIAR